MRLAYAFFAKYADLMKDNTIAAVGGCFDAITFSSFPHVLPVLSVVVRIHVEVGELGPHRFQIRSVIGPDGKPLPDVPESPVVSFTSSIKPGMRFDVFTTVMSIVGLPFPAEGVYRLVFAVDDIDIGGLELDVLRKQEAKND